MRMPGEGGGDTPSAAARAAPLISIVIPVYNAERDLPACLDAITDQSFSDIEIIAVNGGSTDESGEILDARAASEPRLVLAPQDHIGPGLARNVGADLAGGRYLWFVDADDIVLPGTLAVIAEHLSSDGPDMLLIDYEVALPDGTVEPSQDRQVLGRDHPPTFTLAEQLWAIDLTMACWNKIIRTEFFRSCGGGFDKEWPHEDIRLTCLLFTEARTLSALNVPCYRYRRHAPGTLMTSGDPRRHFRAFEVWHDVLDRVRKRAESGDAAVTTAVYAACFARAISHCSNLFGGKVPSTGTFGWLRSHSLVPAGTRREFFANMHSDFVLYKPADYRRPGGPRGVKFWLIERDLYLAYSVLMWVNGLRVSAKRRARRRRAGKS
jgi:CDP-glycerol glycerophosphotransferase